MLSVEAATSLGAELKVNIDGFGLLAEAVLGMRDLRGAGVRHQVGAFVQPSYRFEFGLAPYVAVGVIDVDLDADDDIGLNAIVGLNQSLWDVAFVKLETGLAAPVHPTALVTAGEGHVPVGVNQVVVLDPSLTPESLPVVTFYGDPGSRSWVG